MSRRLLAFLLSELKTVRVICPRKECGSITEVSIDRLRAKFEFASCPVCNHDILPAAGGPNNPLHRLAKAIDELQSVGVGDHIEFVLPDPSAD